MIHKYYEQEESVGVPEWIQHSEICKAEPLDEADKEWCRGFYKKYCDNEEEYHRKLIKNGLKKNV